MSPKKPASFFSSSTSGKWKKPPCSWLGTWSSLVESSPLSMRRAIHSRPINRTTVSPTRQGKEIHRRARTEKGAGFLQSPPVMSSSLPTITLQPITTRENGPKWRIPNHTPALSVLARCSACTSTHGRHSLFSLVRGGPRTDLTPGHQPV